MGCRIVVCGHPAEAEATASQISGAIDGCSTSVVDSPSHLVRAALDGGADVALLLGGAIAAHEDRMDAVRSLRRGGFRGPLLVAAAFLTEKQEALAAGADHAFDPDRQAALAVVRAALESPVVFADHPYLQALLRGDWVTIAPLGSEVPDRPADVLLVATSCHRGGEFWGALAGYRASHPDATVIVVEDEIAEDVLADALAAGATHWCELAGTGIGTLLELARSGARSRWLERLASA